MCGPDWLFHIELFPHGGVSEADLAADCPVSSFQEPFMKCVPDPIASVQIKLHPRCDGDWVNLAASREVGRPRVVHRQGDPAWVYPHKSCERGVNQERIMVAGRGGQSEYRSTTFSSQHTPAPTAASATACPSSIRSESLRIGFQVGVLSRAVGVTQAVGGARPGCGARPFRPTFRIAG